MTKQERTIFTERYGGWILIGLFCLIPVILWLIVNDLSYAFADSYSVFSTFGKLTGLIGYILFAVNMLLALRKQWLEHFFEGLNRVYIAHHITGGLSLVLLVFHPLFLALRYINNQMPGTVGEAAKFLWPRVLDTTLSFSEVQQAASINAGIIAFWGMVVLLILTFFIKLPYRIWLFTHRFLGVAFLFSLFHTITIESDTTQSMMLKVYLILWGIIGIIAFVYRTLLGNILVRKSVYKVVRVIVNGPMTMIELMPLKRPITFKAGQFLFISFFFSDALGISTETHPFSIASGPQENGLRLYVKALGDYTENIKNLQVGTVAEVEGAFGRFVPANYGNKTQVWIGGGIGVTPFLSMARSIYSYPQKIYLIYSVATRSEMVEEVVLKQFLPERFPNFVFIPYVTDEMGGAFLNATFIDQQVGGLQDKEIFICGPPVMMKSLRSQMRDMGVKNSTIHSEEFTMQ